MLVSRLTSNRARGFSLIEAMISSAMLFALLALVLALYFGSYRAWTKNTKHQETLGDLQLVLTNLTADVQKSGFQSVSLSADNKAISFLSRTNPAGQEVYTASGEPLWDHWIVYYTQGANLIRREVPWPVPESARTFPETIEILGAPLETYLTGDGKILSRQLESFVINNPTGTELIAYELKLNQQGKNSQPLRLAGSIMPRN